MFGILEKMDRFSNKLMSEEQEIVFLQECIDNNMLFDMASKYIDAALFYMGQSKVFILGPESSRQEHKPDFMKGFADVEPDFDSMKAYPKDVDGRYVFEGEDWL
jgi:hypothetical protein